jgi:P27 family predicted phage terminase small subunit
VKGPRPKPIELRVIHGGKDAVERIKARVPKPRRVLPRCPEYLTGEAAACWKRTAGDLYDAGLLTAIDRDALAAYCTAFARWREAEGVVEKRGTVMLTAVKKDENGEVIGGGNYVQNPYLSVANKAQEQMVKLMAEFGMTPSARTRVQVTKPTAKSAAKAAVDFGEDAQIEDVLRVLAG